MNPSSNRRKIYLLNPRFQYSFIIFSSVVALLSLCIFYFAILYFFWNLERRGIALGIPSNHIFFRFINEERNSMNLIFIVAAILVFITTSIGALILSHRVAGPLYRLNKHLKQLASEQTLRPVKFRQGDFFLEIQEAFNHFIEYIDARATGEIKPNDQVDKKEDSLE